MKTKEIFSSGRGKDLVKTVSALLFLILSIATVSAQGIGGFSWAVILFWGGLLLLAIGFGLTKFIGLNVRRKDTFKTLGFVALGIWILFFSGIIRLPVEIAEPMVTTTLPIGVVNACPDTGITTAYVKLQDDWSATETYISGASIYARNPNTGIIEKSATTTSDWVSMSLTCNPISPITYEIYATAVPGSSGSAKDLLLANTKDKYLTLHTNQLANMEIRIKDQVNDDWEHMITHGQTAGVNTTTYTALNKTHVFESASGDAIAVGTDGYVDFLMYVKSATPRKFGSDKGVDLGLKTYFCYDTGIDMEWDTATAIMAVGAGGVSLSNVKDTLDKDSKEYSTIMNAEACFEIGDITDVAKELRFYIKTKSGADPDITNDDLTFYIYTEGLYKSSKNANIIQKGVATDAPTPTLVGSSVGYVPEIIVEIQ